MTRNSFLSTLRAALSTSTRRRPRLAHGDVIAGVSVAAVLLPQSLAYASLAGMPPERGLYAAALPPLVAALFACSPYLQTGPVALTSLLTYGALSSLATPGSDEYVKLGIVLALIVGIVRIALGLVKGGVLAYLLSEPVLIGFVPGAAIVICASQIPPALGVTGSGVDVIESAVKALSSPSAWDSSAIGLTVATCLFIAVCARITRLFPAVLVTVGAGIAYSEITGYAEPTVGPISLSMEVPALGIDASMLPPLALSGAVIAFVGFAEPAAIARTFATIERRGWDANRELVSQGAANVASSLSGGFPVGGSLSRSSLNRLAGAKTRASGAVTGITVLVFLPVASVLSALPLATLAAIVIVSVASLVRMRPLVRVLRFSRWQALVAWATFVATIGFVPHVERAVVLGVGLAVVVHLARELRIDIDVDTSEDERTLRFRPRGVLWFASSQVLEDAFVQALARHPSITHVEIDLGRLGRMDMTGAMAIRRMIQHARRASLDVQLKDVPPRAQRWMATLIAPGDELF